MTDDFKDGIKKFFDIFISTFSNLDKALKQNPGVYSVVVTSVIVFLVLLAGLIIYLIIVSARKSSVSSKHKKDFKKIYAQLQESDSLSESQKTFLTECKKQGREIDLHTNRPFNSWYVSEIVYEMCNLLKLTMDKCYLYFCAALIYDVGFLNVPAEIFCEDILNQKERQMVSRHVALCADFLEKAPKDISVDMLLASQLHHENMDGSGYPEGLNGDQIPEIARILRIADSYVSLTTPRSYRRTLSPKIAVAELKKQKNIYDYELVELLEKVIIS